MTALLATLAATGLGCMLGALVLRLFDEAPR